MVELNMACDIPKAQLMEISFAFCTVLNFWTSGTLFILHNGRQTSIDSESMNVMAENLLYSELFLHIVQKGDIRIFSPSTWRYFHLF